MPQVLEADHGGSGQSIGIGAVFARLIAAGHRKAELPHYTLRQLRLFFREAERDRAQRRAARVQDMNIAHHGTVESITEHVLTLQGYE